MYCGCSVADQLLRNPLDCWSGQNRSIGVLLLHHLHGDGGLIGSAVFGRGLSCDSLTQLTLFWSQPDLGRIDRRPLLTKLPALVVVPPAINHFEKIRPRAFRTPPCWGVR